MIGLLLGLVQGSGRKTSIALVAFGGVLLLFGAVGAVVELGGDSTSRQAGQIVDRHVRVIHSLDVGQSQHTRIFGVEVQVGDSTQLLEATGLYDATASAALPVAVTAEENSTGDVKRVNYQGTWYGHETPTVALVIFCLLIVAVGGGAIAVGTIRLRRLSRAAA